MNIIDFEYDGHLASDWGLMMCYINGDSSAVNVLPAGAEVNFNQVGVQGGRKWFSTDTTYDSPLEVTFQMCKYDCTKREFIALDITDQRAITRWLNRPEDHRCRFISNDHSYDYVYFEGKFNLSKIETANGIIGYELHFISNRPFALGLEVKRKITLLENESVIFNDTSDEIGYIYPTLTVKCLSSGKLILHNSIEDRSTIIENCSENEIITFYSSLRFESSSPNHKIQNDFNFKFFRIANTYNNRKNIITSSLPCEIIIEYSPIVKGVGL